MTVDFQFDYTDTERKCSRGPDACRGKVFARTSHSGLTRSWMCEGHAEGLDQAARDIERRYPEVNHPEGCGCYGCSEGSW